MAKSAITKFANRSIRLGLMATVLATSSLAISTLTYAATPLGTIIPNTANANYTALGVPITATSTATLTVGGRTPSKIELLQYDANPSGATSANVIVGLTSCNGTPLSAPTTPPSTTLVVPGVLRLAPATAYNIGDPIFVRLTDLDQNANPLVAETITTTITTAGGDSETITLTETGLSTGVFTGYIQSASAVASPVNNCKLNVTPSQKITAEYTDPLDIIKTVASSVFIDPFGIVFDSVTGVPVNGASVSVIDNTTGLPAVVLCDNNVTVLTQPVISGAATTCDASIAAGGYRFPRLPSGSYHLNIVQPSAYVFPSTAPIPNLPVGFVIVGPLGTGASYGGNFTLVLGHPAQIDVPLDSANVAGSLMIVKTVSKDTVAIGDFVPYTITIKNTGAAIANNVVIADAMPIGFRFAKNSAKLDNIALSANNPVIANDGRTLKFNLSNIAVGSTVTLKYVAEVAAGAKLGSAENIAFSTSHSSNIGRASVTVREDLFRSKSLLVGRVIEGCPANIEEASKGLQGARILLEDGTYITTDKDGRWHADNIKPGTHVVQLDKDSLPNDIEVISCATNNRFAGRTYSQFVNIQGGTMWRADFYVQKKAGAKEDSGKPEALPTDGANQRAFQLVEKLPFNSQWLAAAPAGAEWLHPQANFTPALPIVKAAIKAAPGQVINIKINGAKVNPLNYDGAQENAAHTVSLATWSAIPLKNGDNLLNVTVTDKDGKTVLEETRTIHYSSAPVRAVLDEKLSHLIADGKTKPVIAVRLLDDAGKPVRRGLGGDFEINAPYQSHEQFEAIQREPLAAKVGGKAHFEVGADGVASIELMPTTQTGEVVLNFALSSDVKSQKEVRAWLAPGQRDWVLVGFAEGTTGHKTLNGNMTALKDSGAPDQLFDQDRVAFYAKGSIKGDYLLTMAYDTAKQRGQAVQRQNSNLKQAIDPNQYYTLYADATQPQFDAASARKLYLKVEKNQFYAMFGDYDTGLTVTELSRYSRTLNGVKSEYKGKQLSYSVFATETAQAFKRDEIRGDGTSGLYQLSSGNLVINSDKIRIETRDRFHSEVIIKTDSMTRYLDYDIDTSKGTLFFHQPIQSRDANLNPTYIVAEYEAGDAKDEKLSYGGRVAVKPSDKIEIGVSHVHEGNVGSKGDLNGADVTVNLSDKTKVRAEYANTNTDINNVKKDGDAWLVELTHQDEKSTAKVYAREQQSGFGIGQQASGESGTRKIGANGSYKFNETTQLQAETYRQEVIDTNATRNVAEARVQWQKDALTTHAGVRVAEDTIPQAAGTSDKIQSSKQLTAGVGYALFEKKLQLHASIETAIGSNENSDFPNRYRLGADYKLGAHTSLFAEDEIAVGDKIKANTSRIGLRTSPWQGGEMAASLGNEIQQDSGRLFASLGLTQRWQINEHWQADAGLDHSQTIKNTASQLNGNVPLTSGGGLNGTAGSTADYTASSVGVHFNDKAWSANSRVEYRTSDTEDKINVLVGAQRNLDNGRSVAAGIIFNDVSGLISSTKFDARLSAAFRPNDSRWIWLDRLDYIDEKTNNVTASLHTKKLINNFNANYLLNHQTQIALQYAAKYVLDDIDSTNYSGYTDLAGAELRYDINSKWDIGVHGSMLHSWNGGQRDYALGVSLGYSLMENTWVSVGYNVKGFSDNDFSGAEYRVKGFYLNLRVKFDQDTLGLNKPSNANPLERK